MSGQGKDWQADVEQDVDYLDRRSKSLILLELIGHSPS